jgi:hypothetical protein
MGRGCRRADEALQQSEQRYQLAIAGVNQGAHHFGSKTPL